jgi:hypothetical protein
MARDKSVAQLAVEPEHVWPAGAMDGRGWRYPRERLLNSLPLLLWNGEVTKDSQVLHGLQRELQTQSRDWSGFVKAYQKIWAGYG